MVHLSVATISLYIYIHIYIHAQRCGFQADYGKIDVLIHSLANGPEVTKPLLETSRAGYLAASSASAYSFVSLVRAACCACASAV